MILSPYVLFSFSGDTNCSWRRGSCRLDGSSKYCFPRCLGMCVIDVLNAWLLTFFFVRVWDLRLNVCLFESNWLKVYAYTVMRGVGYVIYFKLRWLTQRPRGIAVFLINNIGNTASVSGFQCSTFSTLTFIIKRILIIWIHAAVSVINKSTGMTMGSTVDFNFDDNKELKKW